MSNYFVQELVLYRHFMLIDSPIPFELIANPTNFRKDEHGNVLNTDLSEITGRDICSRPAGAWRVDCWTLLPEKYHKQNPVFTMLIKYDKDLLEEGEIVDIRYSDIDIGEGVAGVNGQLVSIPSSDFRPIVLAVKSASESVVGSVDSLSRKSKLFVDSNSLYYNFTNTLPSWNTFLNEFKIFMDSLVRGDVLTISLSVSTSRIGESNVPAFAFCGDFVFSNFDESHEDPETLEPINTIEDFGVFLHISDFVVRGEVGFQVGSGAMSVISPCPLIISKSDFTPSDMSEGSNKNVITFVLDTTSELIFTMRGSDYEPSYVSLFIGKH